MEAVIKSNCPGKPLQAIMATGFFVVDRNWTVIYWNNEAEKITGKPAIDVVGLDLWQACSMAIPDNFHSYYHKAFQQPIPNPQKVLQWPEIGYWADVVSYQSDDTLSVSFRSNLPAGREKDQQNRLASLQETYRFLTEVSADCLWEWDIPAKEFFWLDGGHKRAFGYPITDAIVPQEFWQACIHPEDKARVLKGLEDVVASGAAAIWEDEYRFKKMDGTYAHVQDRAFVICDKGNTALRMIGATHDITAAKQAEMRLLESERIIAEERVLKQKEVTEAVIAAQELKELR